MPSKKRSTSQSKRTDQQNSVERETPRESHPQQPLRQFTLNEYLSHSDNSIVIKTFVRFSISVAVAPIAAFFAAQYLALLLKVPLVSDGSVVGAIASLTVLVSLMAGYAYHAYQEEKRDYLAQHPEEHSPIRPAGASAIARKSQ